MSGPLLKSCFPRAGPRRGPATFFLAALFLAASPRSRDLGGTAPAIDVFKSGIGSKAPWPRCGVLQSHAPLARCTSRRDGWPVAECGHGVRPSLFGPARAPLSDDPADAPTVRCEAWTSCPPRVVCQSSSLRLKALPVFPPPQRVDPYGSRDREPPGAVHGQFPSSRPGHRTILRGPRQCSGQACRTSCPGRGSASCTAVRHQAARVSAALLPAGGTTLSRAGRESACDEIAPALTSSLVD